MRRTTILRSRALAVLLVLATVACVDGGSRRSGASPPTMTRALSDSAFAALSRQLSEPGGYFDTDNLISNETSYLHVVGTLEELGVRGGAYIGVGPDQNFSYIAAVQPAIAFIIDIRRDNLLLQLMFKAMFELADRRIEYLCLLFGRPVPEDPADWEGHTVHELVAYIDGEETTSELTETSLALITSEVQRFGLPLNPEDVAVIRRFHATFIGAGLDLRFQSYGRRPRPYYPTYRRLLLETDLKDRQVNYLAREEDFRFVKSLQERNLVVPVVGDLAGPHAMGAIAAEIEARDLLVSALYTSNVEFYLVQDRTIHAYARNVRRLPRDENSMIIRSYFGRNFGFVHPQAVPGYYSVQLLQPLNEFVEEFEDGRYENYLDIVTGSAIEVH